MKHQRWISLSVVSCISSIISFAQPISNASFEIGRSNNAVLPDKWGLKKPNEFTVSLDSTVAKTGQRSLKIACSVQSPTASQGFGQSFPVHVDRPTKFRLLIAVRTKNLDKISLLGQLWNGQKQMGFVNVPQVSGSGEWRDMALDLLVTPRVDRLFFAADYRGNQQAWFDDVRLQVDSLTSAKPTRQVVAYLNQVIALVKAKALVRDSIPWQQTQSEMMAFAAGMQTRRQAHSIIDYLLQVMNQYGDNHTRFYRPEQVEKLNSSQLDRETPQPQAKYLSDGIGLVAVPQFMNLNQTRKVAFATQIQQLIKGLDRSHSVRGWIVDLRENGGGSVYPMISGLGPLIGEGTLGYFVDAKGETPWGYRAGESYEGKPGQGTKVKAPYRLRTKNVPIAVLIGPHTASSGESTAIAFIGRPHSRSFGSPTAGLTTANEGYPLSDGARLNLADALLADRTHKLYPHGLVPDEAVDVSAADKTDVVLARAKAWLLTQ